MFGEYGNGFNQYPPMQQQSQYPFIQQKPSQFTPQPEQLSQIVFNMAYSDYAKVFGTNANLYINWTLAYMQDPDAKSGKALRQYFREQEDY